MKTTPENLPVLRKPFGRLRPAIILAFASFAWLTGTTNLAATQIAERPLTLAVSSFQPNILLIPDTSESMQEGLSLGRVALDWDNCVPGPDMDPDECPAGARSPFSKASIVKGVGLDLIENYRGLVNMGLLSYQQNPPSPWRNDVFASPDSQDTGPGTVLWRLVHRPGDVRFATTPNPPFYDPNFTGSLTSNTKRFREPHPFVDGMWVFYNFAAPGYHRDEDFGTPESDLTTFALWSGLFFGTGDKAHWLFRNMHISQPGAGDRQQDADSGFWFSNRYQNANQFWRITRTDSMRQRGIPEWGDRILFTQLNQLEWRSNTSPGLGYLHVPIRGNTGNLQEDNVHWDALVAKLQPQRHDWEDGDGNVLVDPSWPLIASGLTPLDGTMRTATDYFINAGGDATASFGADQGWNEDVPPLPTSCGINANIWITDGLPTVRADGTLLGDNPAAALLEARDAISDLYEDTEEALGEGVRTYIVGFALPPGVDNLPNMPADPLDVLATAGRTDQALMADDRDSLQAAMNNLFQQIIADSEIEVGSQVSGSVQIDDAIGFRFESDPSNWSGEMIGLRNPNLPSEQEIWRANGEMPSGAMRNLLTAGSSFNLGAGGLSEEALESIHPNATVAENVVRYVRGGFADVLDNMQGLGVSFFDRGDARIGTIAGSAPVLQRVRNLGWAQLPASQGGGSVYAEFVQNKEDLPRVVYVGSNLGVLHAFDVDTGEELFGYVPRGVFPNLYRMATRDFQYTVDGNLSLFDAYQASRPAGQRWRQILVGTLGAGGKSIYALDVTDPENPSFMWEIGPDDLPPGQEDRLGFTFGTTQVARLENGDWALVAGNGYGSDRGRASLVKINLFTGSVAQTVEVNNQGNNGLSAPRVARDVLNRGTTDRWAYAGDLRGNLWRFDLGESLSSNVTVQRVFEGDRPITMQPQTIYPEEGNGYIVVFGTGKYFELGDDNIQNAPSEYMYVIRDGGAAGPSASGLKQSDLVNRSTAISGGSAGEFNLFERNNQGFVHNGWYAALDYGGQNGARALFTPDFRLGRLLFTSFRPNDDPCEVGGRSNVYMMNLREASGAFPSGQGFTPLVGSEEGAPVTATYVTRVETVDGDVEASTAISYGSTLVDIDDPEFDQDALPRAFGERLNWRQNR